MNHRHSLFLAAVLAAPLIAQDTTTKPAPTVAQGPALVLKTSDHMVAAQAAAMFDRIDDLPQIPDGGHLVLSLGADKKLAVTTGSGDVGLADLVADPAALMDLYAEELESVLPMARGALTMGFQQGGLQPKDAARHVKNMLDFPKQLQKVALKVAGGQSTGGFDSTFSIEGKPGSDFETFVGWCKPSSQGAPVLAAKDAAMVMSFSLAPDALAAMFAPVRELALSMVTKDEAQRKEFGTLYDQWIALYDGGAGVTIGENMRMSMLVGVLDGAKVREMLSSEAYLAVMRDQKLPDPDMKVEVSPDGFEHRGTKLGKQRVSGGEPNPMMPDGVMESYFGAVGNYMVMAMNGSETGAKELVDAVLDQKVKRAPLAGDAILRLDLDLAAMVEQMGMGAGAPEGMPTQVNLSAAAVGKALQIKLHLK